MPVLDKIGVLWLGRNLFANGLLIQAPNMRSSNSVVESRLLESNGVSDCLWALRATTKDSEVITRLIAADCDESVLYIYQEKYSNDNRPRLALQAARDFANGLIDFSTLLAADSAALDAAANAAYNAYTAADIYAYSSCADERSKQAEIIKKYLSWE